MEEWVDEWVDELTYWEYIGQGRALAVKAAGACGAAVDDDVEDGGGAHDVDAVGCVGEEQGAEHGGRRGSTRGAARRWRASTD